MSDAYAGEIRMLCGSYAPQGWAFCDGTSLSVSTHAALYSVLGTTYGGNGFGTFQLPDLRGRVPLHYGQAPGLSVRLFGATLGAETIALTSGEYPPRPEPGDTVSNA